MVTLMFSIRRKYIKIFWASWRPINLWPFPTSLRQCSRHFSISALSVLLVPTLAFSDDFYIAHDGSDNNPGSINLPWRSIKSSVKKLRAGDTLYIREGKYYESHIYQFPNEATSDQRITIRNYQDEVVVVTGDILLNEMTDWQQQGDTNIYRHQPLRQANYDNLSQKGVPLRLVDQSGDISKLNAEGEWVRDSVSNLIWVIVKGGGKPWLSEIALSDAHNIFSLQEGANFITIEGLTVENAYYPVQVYSDDVHIVNLVIRNSYGDGIKVEGWHGDGPDWNSENGIIKGCNIYNFGESAIDVTGGDHWSILDNMIHNAVPIKDKSEGIDGYYTNGLMIKNDNIGMLVEGNIFYDFTAKFGAITLGVNTYYSDQPVTSDAIIRHNEFRNISAPYIISFSGAIRSTFIENSIFNSTIFNAGEKGVVSAPEALIQFRNGYCEKPWCRDMNGGQDIRMASSFNTVSNNVYSENNTKYIYKEIEAYGLDNDAGNIIEANIYLDTALSSFDGRVFSRNELATLKGYDKIDTKKILNPPAAVEHIEAVKSF